MRQANKIIGIMVSLLLCCTSFTGFTQEMRTMETRIADILAQFPASTPGVKNKLAEEIIDLGPTGIMEICKMVTAPGRTDDTTVRYALNGLAIYAARPGANEQQKVVSKTFIMALEPNLHHEVKAFLIRQLQIVGKGEAIKPLSTFLQDQKLCEPATQAMLTIGTEEAEKMFLKHLSSVKDANRITLIKALGELRCRKAVKKLTGYAENEDRDTRLVALWAIANIGDKSARKILALSMESSSSYERTKATSYYLLYSRRRAEAGKIDECAEICRYLIKNRTKSYEQNVPCAALSTLVELLGEKAFKDMLKAVESDNIELQGRALELSNSIPGKSATAAWVARLDMVLPETCANIITMLGKRRDRSALTAIRKFTGHENATVRSASIMAAARLGGDDVMPSLLKIFKNGESKNIGVVKSAILSFTTEEVIPLLADALPGMPAVSRAAIMEILSERHSTDYLEVVLNQTNDLNHQVRLAAITALENFVSCKELPVLIDLLLRVQEEDEIQAAQHCVIKSANQIPDPEKRSDIILSKLSKTTGPGRKYLIETLSQIGGENALNAVVKETRNKNPELQDAAVYTLASWPDLSAAKELLNIGKQTEQAAHKSRALNGYVRLVESSKLSPVKKLEMLNKAMEAADLPDEKKRVLSGAAKVRTFESLKFVANYMDNEILQQDAANAAVNIACPQSGSDKGLSGPEVTAVLKRVMNIITEEYTVKQVEGHLYTLSGAKPIKTEIGFNLPPEGFVALFNGKDLTGWKGLAGNGGSPISRSKMSKEELARAQLEADDIMYAHWQVEDGILTFDGYGSHLCTERDYGDFELLVDWKIEPNGDSGIYLRGSPQVQIWDPAQWPEGSGGLYNNQKNPSKPLVPADNPIGEWNSFRIKMIGGSVTIHLNDVLAVDNVIMENYWDRSQPIFPAGQIELQSHGSKLCFRNIFIREIFREAEWRKLFNGKDFTGWTGATSSYLAKDGKIICPKDGGGNLYTEDEFDDFILRFEFKLTPGANNGLGIRAPLEGDAAYVGMELQILDNTAHIYKDLKPYQYHGSIYGVVPAKRGHLRAVGEWNVEEVIAKGSHITVHLNGVKIVDEDIMEAIKHGTIDGRDHPGLFRGKGHIGFLGHGSRVEFRNIFLKELK